MPTTVAHISNDKAAIYTKPASGPVLGPFTNPEDHLELVKFHSDFDYYEVFSGPTNVNINHAQVNGRSQSTTYPGDFTVTKNGRTVIVTHDLVTHGLGYVPDFIVIHNDVILAPSTLIQIQSNGAGRFVTPFATTTKIRLFDFGVGSASGENLSATTLTYTVVVFKAPAVTSDDVFSWDNATGKLTLGKGKFKNDVKMLRSAAVGDSPYDLSLGPAHDIKNGRTRFVAPDGTVATEPGYDGTFTGPSTIQAAIS